MKERKRIREKIIANYRQRQRRYDEMEKVNPSESAVKVFKRKPYGSNERKGE